MIYNSVTELIGKTPIVKLNKITDDIRATVLLKLEYFNPGGSVKDRIGLNMIEEAEKSGLINEQSHIIEPTSGNTGIGLAMVCAAKGYKLTLTMPESMSIERRKILRAYGANLVLTDQTKGMKGSIAKAEEIANKDPNGIILQQFKNPANPDVHRKTTALEILDATGGKLNAFVAGVGTGGTITGTGEILKEKIPGIKIYAVEPKDSPVLSGGDPGPHKLAGIGAGFIPDILNTHIYDGIETIEYEEAVLTARRLASEEGIFVGYSGGAAVTAALKIAKTMDENQTILAIVPDTGERYLSNPIWNIE
ncbi:MAG: cysteine synthase A [Candidatus Heimdallarchaeota archaeon]|nr:cysteine synthase A [Candidatus Heimdallarchaeota archaeon]